MNTVPLWKLADLAESLNGDTVWVDTTRVHCPFWVGESYANTVVSLAELFEVASRIAVSGVLAQPIRPLDSENPAAGVAQRNRTFAASAASWTLLANGVELHPQRAIPAIAAAEQALELGHTTVAEVVAALASAMAQLPHVAALPFEFERDPVAVARPTPPTLYIASALTGFRDVTPEWLWLRDVEAPPSVRDAGGRWTENRSERSQLALAYQRQMNSRVASYLRAAGIDAFVPHEHFDPDHHTDKPPAVVDLGDRIGVAQADAIVFLGDYPATGAGKELAWAEGNLALTILVASADTRTSRLLSGTPHLTSEVVDGYESWPSRVLEVTLDHLGRLERHAQRRAAAVLRAKSYLDRLPPEPLSDVAMSHKRVRQLRQQPDLFPAASLLELQAMFRAFGQRLELHLTPLAVDQPRATPAIDVEAEADSFLTQSRGLRNDAPNSADAIRRALAVRAPIVDEMIDGDGQTIRDDNGKFEIRLKNSNPTRARFTLAHELAHILVERDELTVSHRHGHHPDHRYEFAINELAAALLMPREWVCAVRGDLQASGVPRNSVEELVRLANYVSLAPDVAALRLTSLQPTAPVVLAELAHEGADGWRTQRVAGLPYDWFAPSAPAEVQVRVEGLPPMGSLDTAWSGQVAAHLAALGPLIAHASLKRSSRRPDSALVALSDFVRD